MQIIIIVMLMKPAAGFAFHVLQMIIIHMISMSMSMIIVMLRKPCSRIVCSLRLSIPLSLVEDHHQHDPHDHDNCHSEETLQQDPLFLPGVPCIEPLLLHPGEPRTWA